MRGLVSFARNRLGVRLYPGQVDVLTSWVRSGRRKCVLCLGRRSGKGLMGAVAAIFNAVAMDYSGTLRKGETRFILVVATREQQAREFVRVVRELLEAAPDPDLAELVDPNASTDSEVVFTNGVVIRAMPCSSRSTRGLAASLVVLDELGHFQTDSEGYQAGRTVWRALTPSVAQFRDRGYVLVTSTPSWASGILHDLVTAGDIGVDRDLLVIRKPTWEVNPTITRESLDAEFSADPESAKVEFGGDFAEGGGAYLDRDAIHAAVVPGRRWLPPLPGTRYVGAADPAFAAGGDAFTFCVAHKVGRGEQATYVVDRLESWRGKKAPLSSDLILDEIADLARLYHLSDVVSDQYALIPLSDGLRRRGVTLKPQPLTSELKADIFSALKRALNMGSVELVDDSALIAELAKLEVRPSPAGKPRIAAARGGRDDLAMVVATAVHALGAGAVRTKTYPRVSGDLKDIMPRRARHVERQQGRKLGVAASFALAAGGGQLRRGLPSHLGGALNDFADRLGR